MSHVDGPEAAPYAPGASPQTNSSGAPVDPHTAAWGSAPLAAADQLFIVEGTAFISIVVPV